MKIIMLELKTWPPEPEMVTISAFAVSSIRDSIEGAKETGKFIGELLGVNCCISTAAEVAHTLYHQAANENLGIGPYNLEHFNGAMYQGIDDAAHLAVH